MNNPSIRFTVVLLLISAVSAGLLGWVNSITAPLIMQRAQQDAILARQEVLPGADYYYPVKESVLRELSKEVPLLQEVYVGLKGSQVVGYVFTTAPKGYGGDVVTMVGLKENGLVQNVKVVSQNETPGLGSKVTENANPEDFLGEKNLSRMREKGLNENISLNKDGGSIQAVTGATISSRAVITGVNAARETLKILKDRYQILSILDKENTTREEGGGK